MGTPPSRPPPLRSLLVTITFAVAFNGCDTPEAQGACETLGLCEAPRPPPEDFVVLCDATPGSTCNTSSLDAALEAVIHRAIERPGSTVRVWNVADDAREIARAKVSDPPRRVRAPERHRAQEVERLRRELRDAASPAIGLGAELRRSPVAEAITRVARMAAAPAVRRYLVVISDFRELTTPGGIDLECPRRLPYLDRFDDYLDARSLLRSGSLTEWRVTMIARDLPRIPTRRRCDLTLRRLDDLVAMWTAVLRQAGASVEVRTETNIEMFSDTNNTTSTTTATAEVAR